MIELIIKELASFRQVFSREKTFQWFCLVVIGFIIAQDRLGGVSSLIRSLGLGNPAYHAMLNFFLKL